MSHTAPPRILALAGSSRSGALKDARQQKTLEQMAGGLLRLAR